MAPYCGLYSQPQIEAIDDQRQHGGGVEDQPEDRLAAHLAVEQDRQRQSDDHREDDGDHGPDEVVDRPPG